MVLWHVDRYNSLSIDDLERLVKSDEQTIMRDAGKDDVLVHGPGGHRVTERQISIN